MLVQELKNNLVFFISMSLVLTLLFSAGVSLFNFSFEIYDKIYESIEERFEYGYTISIDEFVEMNDTLRKNGISQASYYGVVKKVAGIDEPTFYPEVFVFENQLPTAFRRANVVMPNLLVEGSLWTAADNTPAEGKHPIFICQSLAELATLYGLNTSVGSTLELCEPILEYVVEDGQLVDIIIKESISKQFFVKGIYKDSDYLPMAVISLNAEKEFSNSYEDREEIGFTYLTMDSAADFKKFSAYAKSIGLKFYAGVEEDIGLANLFSVLFAVLSILILLMCGAIAFIYCNMFINKRINFIGLLKALGLSSKSIAVQIYLLLLIVFFTAFTMANVFSIFLTKHFANLSKALLDYTLNTGFNPLSQLVFAILTALTALLSALLLSRRISKISISNVLTQRE